MNSSRLFGQFPTPRGSQNGIQKLGLDFRTFDSETLRGYDQIVLKKGFELRANVKQLGGGGDDIGCADSLISAIFPGQFSHQG